LIPNIKELESHLKEFCEICESDEVVLFERATFLVISHATRTEHRDMHRFEKISNIIKQFKLSCSKTQAQFQAMEVKNSNFTAFIDYFTTNTYVMVIMSDPTVRKCNAPFARLLVSHTHCLNMQKLQPPSSTFEWLDSISSSSSSQNLSELRRRLGMVGKRRCFIRIQIPEQPLPYPFRSQIPEKPQKLGISGASQRQQPGGR
jgi:hypothetical protein